ncbi:hypothetical protein ABZ173_33780 [Streptomyces rochei]|uniref:hypothetical protein n=1 Tax=Streptomyces TaxID=1883 RepID=UPI0033B47EEB
MNTAKLARSSSRWMQLALTTLGRGENGDIAVHHAAVASEHLLKAYLASIHPVLITEGKDFTSLLHAVGRGSQAPAPITAFRSIGLPDAYGRVAILLPALPVDATEVKAVANARNGVAHSGVHDDTCTRELITVCIRLADAVLPHVPAASPDEYWGETKGVRNRLIAAHTSKLRDKIEKRINRFREAYKNAKLPDDWARETWPPTLAPDWDRDLGGFRLGSPSAVLLSLRATDQSVLEGMKAVVCIACQQRSLVPMIHKQPEDDEAAARHSALCFRCGLYLNAEELFFLGLGEVIGLPAYGN